MAAFRANGCASKENERTRSVLIKQEPIAAAVMMENIGNLARLMRTRAHR